MDYKISRSSFPFYENFLFQFSPKLHLQGFRHRWCFKLYWRTWADGVSKQDQPALLWTNQEAALNSVQDKMLTLGISIIEHSDLFVGAAHPMKKGTSLGFASRKMTRTLWATRNCIKSSVTTTFHPALNSPTRLTDKQQSSGYLTVGVPSEFQKLLSWCRPQMCLKH